MVLVNVETDKVVASEINLDPELECYFSSHTDVFRLERKHVDIAAPNVLIRTLRCDNTSEVVIAWNVDMSDEEESKLLNILDSFTSKWKYTIVPKSYALRARQAAKKIYCNSSRLMAKLLLPRTGNMDEADLLLLSVDIETTKVELVHLLTIALQNSSITYVYLDILDSDYCKDVLRLFKEFVPHVYTSIESLKEALGPEIALYREFSISTCIEQTARNYDVPVTDEDIRYLASTIEQELKTHSAYACATALLYLFDSKRKLLPISYKESLEYCSTCWYRVERADEVYKKTGSNFKSIFSAGCSEKIDVVPPEYEMYVMSVLFQPYDASSSVANRVDMIVGEFESTV